MSLSRTLTVALGAGVFALGAASSAHAAVLTVNDTGDKLGATLRNEIIAANKTKTPDTIKFAVPGTGVHTIKPTSELPEIKFPLTIDGYSQSGASPATATSPAVLKVALDAGGSSRALVIQSHDVTVRGLAIQGADSEGIEVDGHDNVVAGNHIGVDAAGTAKVPDGAFGVTLNGADNAVGGPDPGDRNVISGHTTAEVAVEEGAGNLVQGNRVGTDADGAKAFGFATGVSVTAGSSQILGNLISGETEGAEIIGDDNVVQGNLVGTDADGTAAVPNFVGLNVLGAAGNQIGGSGDGERNVISGNEAGGLQLIADSDGNPSQDNVVQGNLIGVDASGSKLGNGASTGLAGVTVGRSSQNTIGGTEEGEGNVIAGNGGAGVELSEGGNDNSVLGNWIGTDSTGALLGNTGSGVHIKGGDNNTVGDTGAGTGNTIAHNGDDGVSVELGAGDSVLRNSIHDNSDLAIDLGDSDTSNDGPLDEDEGPNGLQNGPQIATATATRVDWSLDTEASTRYRIEFYANDDCTNKHVTEAQTFLGAITVTTDSNGHADDDDDGVDGTPITLPAGAGPYISTTATELGVRRPTSEVSPCQAIVA